MILLLGDTHNVWMKALKSISKNVEAIQGNTNIEEQRKAFGLLGKDLSDVVDMLGIIAPENKTVYLEFCPMADDNKGAFWLSYDKEIANPFFGQSMATCGEVKKEYK
jgi:Cu(I)/Ag(I) efflux system membrane fusion protein